LITSPNLTVMINAARKAARGLQRDFGEVENLQVSLKGPANFVTKSDQRAEGILQAELTKARPAYGLLMEEGGAVAGRDAEHRWLIDPIDGTTNFIHGIPHFAISIALERAGTVVAGVIYNPISNDLFIAERGRGAFLNDRRLRVAARRELREAVIGCGIPHLGRGDQVQFNKELSRVQPKVAGVRRFGSAALDLAWVAAGRLDGYWERGLKAWDIAAGLLLVREAGGRAEDIAGANPLVTGDIVAGNDDLVRALLGEIVAA
jgi:myo-inositol-1(or 4)-monophosphatase